MILAHGVGARRDLPLPLDLMLQAAAVALLVSFLGLGLLWTKPRFRGDAAGSVLPKACQRLIDARGFRLGSRLLTLLGALFVLVVALLGPDSARNPAPYVIYVLFWVGLAIASMLLGPLWRVLNPLRLLPSASGRIPYPEWLGYWPAATGLLAFTWLELAAPGRSSPRVVALFFVCYVLVQLVGSLVFGECWFERADPFEVYSTLLGHLAPFGRRGDGRLVLRVPFDGLAAIPVRPGLVAVVAVCFGATAFDGLSGTPTWARLVQSSGVGAPLPATVGLVLTVGVVITSYLGATALAGRGIAGPMAHSLVPIVAGYVVAHYYSLLIVEGQRTFILLSDPFGHAATLPTPDASLAAPGIVAVVQVVAVLLGHVFGVVAAHDRALRLLPARDRLSGQAPLLLVMVGYTAGGLTLLFAG